MRAIALTVLLASPLLANAAAQNLVVNGGFESTAQANGTWNIYQNLPGWTGGVAGVELRNNVAGAALEGHNFVELDTTRNSSISQSINTTAGGHYVLSFAYSPRPGVASGSNQIEALWNGNSLGVFTATGGSLNTWSTYSFNVTGNGGPTSLLFRAIGASDSYGGSLDKVSLVTSAVPEPETYAMMLAGLAGLGLMSRRKKSVALTK
jgi:hypothetical protein